MISGSSRSFLSGRVVEKDLLDEGMASMRIGLWLWIARREVVRPRLRAGRRVRLRRRRVAILVVEGDTVDGESLVRVVSIMIRIGHKRGE